MLIYKPNYFLDEEDDEEESSQIRREEANFEFIDFVKKLDIYYFKLMLFKFLNRKFSFINFNYYF